LVFYDIDSGVDSGGSLASRMVSIIVMHVSKVRLLLRWVTYWLLYSILIFY